MSNSSNFYNKVKVTIEKYKMVNKGQIVLIGLSGGADSVALLEVLCHFSKEYQSRIVIAHLNHCLRGEESDNDEQLAIALAQKYGCEIVVESADVKAYCEKNKLCLEDGARELRYSFFERVAKEKKVNRIAVAHHQDDNIETFLMRVIRGSGVKGLSGIPYIRALGEFLIVRPFLDVSRKDIMQFIQDKGLVYREDASNKENDMTRNKVRNILIPMLEKEYNPSLKKSIVGEISSLAAVNDFVQLKAQMDFKKAVAKVSDTEFNIVCKNIKALPYALQLEIIRKTLFKFGNNVKRQHIMAVHDLINNKESGKKLVLDGGLRVIKVYDFVRLSKNENTSQGFTASTRVPGVVSFGDWKWKATVLLFPAGEEIKAKKYPWAKWGSGKQIEIEAFFDYDSLKSNTVEFRTRKPGDKYQPMGMQYNKKIKDIFIDEKVPVDWRENIPVVLSGERIIFLAGYRPASFCKVTQNTKKILKLNLTASID